MFACFGFGSDHENIGRSDDAPLDVDTSSTEEESSEDEDSHPLRSKSVLLDQRMTKQELAADRQTKVFVVVGVAPGVVGRPVSAHHDERAGRCFTLTATATHGHAVGAKALRLIYQAETEEEAAGWLDAFTALDRTSKQPSAPLIKFLHTHGGLDGIAPQVIFIFMIRIISYILSCFVVGFERWIICEGEAGIPLLFLKILSSVLIVMDNMLSSPRRRTCARSTTWGAAASAMRRSRSSASTASSARCCCCHACRLVCHACRLISG
eukprot:COSAG01_NODE_9137_length_2541_cov_4.615479_3_plen_266_part_00